MLDELIDRTASEIEAILRGGPGSGHHDHRGRPGEVGGSLPSDEGFAPSLEDLEGPGIAPDPHSFNENLYTPTSTEDVTKTGLPIPGEPPPALVVEPDDPVEIRGWWSAGPRVSSLKGFQQRGAGRYISLDRPFNPSDEDILHEARLEIPLNTILDPNGVIEGTDVEASRDAWSWGYERANELHREMNIYDLGERDTLLPKIWATMGYRAIAGWIEPGLPEWGRELSIWDKGTVSMRRLNSEETKDAIEEGREYEDRVLGLLEERGGPGSGHHGHAGRPGEVGGSLPGVKGFPGIPSNLLHVARMARHYSNFDEFSHDWSVKNYHGLFFHLTNNPEFTIDPTLGPRDNSSLGTGKMSAGKLMVTTDIENWAETLGPRPYVAVIDLTELEPGVDYGDATRGFGQEIYVSNPTNARVAMTMPLEEAIEFSRYLYEDVYPHSKSELREIWEWAQAQPVLRGGPGSGHRGHRGRPGKRGGSLPDAVAGENLRQYLTGIPKTPLWAPVNRAIDAIEKVHGVYPLPELRVWRSQSKQRRGAYHTIVTPDGQWQPESMSVVLNKLENAVGDKESRALTTAHEIGHFLDHVMFGRPDNFTTDDMIDGEASLPGQEDKLLAISFNPDEARALQNWWEAVRNSDAYKAMAGLEPGYYHIGRDGMAHKGMGPSPFSYYKISPSLLNNWRQAREYFARSYAQYIAVRSGDPWMLNEVESELEVARKDIAYTQWEEDDFEPIADAFDKLFDSLGLRR